MDVKLTTLEVTLLLITPILVFAVSRWVLRKSAWPGAIICFLVLLVVYIVD